jgi:hypothetical protein
VSHDALGGVTPVWFVLLVRLPLVTVSHFLFGIMLLVVEFLENVTGCDRFSGVTPAPGLSDVGDTPVRFECLALKISNNVATLREMPVGGSEYRRRDARFCPGISSVTNGR